jgi:hypothetical protein
MLLPVMDFLRGDDTMNRIAKTLLTTGLLMMAAAPVYADRDDHDRGRDHRPSIHQSDRDRGHRPSIHRRMEEQEHRIREGIRRGELTPREAERLQHEQREIREAARDFRDDGNVNRREWRRLNEMLNRADRHIYELKHNRWERERRLDHHRNWGHDRDFGFPRRY